MSLKLRTWYSPDVQYYESSGNSWSVSRLFELSRNLPVMEVPLEHLYMAYEYDNVSLLDMVMHMQAVNDADLSKPIILSENGVIMDGRHRLMKALLTGQNSIKCVRFERTPQPCTTTN